MKDIQFDLEKWQTGKYDVFTLEEKAVTKLTDFETARSAFRLAGVVEGLILKWMKNGCCYQDSTSPKDLVLRPKVKTRWHNVWEDPDGLLFISPNGFDSKEEAKIGAAQSKSTNTYIKTIAVTNEREDQEVVYTKGVTFEVGGHTSFSTFNPIDLSSNAK